VTVRLALRMERATIRWGTALAAPIVAGMAVTVIGMMSVIGGMSCDPDFTGGSCAAVVHRFAPWEQAGSALVGSMWALPVLLGSIIGVAITAGELERRTAHVSWSLSGDRRRWLLFRALPAGAFLVVVLGAGALGAELVTRARLITDDAGFIDYQLRTALVPLRGLLAFAIAIAVGAQLGRVLPALLITIAVAAAATAALGILVDAWHLGSAQFVSLARLVPGQYPLIVRPGETQWPQGQGVMQIPIGDFGKWVAIEAAAYLSLTAGIAIVADGIVAKRSPR
jgi:hypothetical protein